MLSDEEIEKLLEDKFEISSADVLEIDIEIARAVERAVIERCAKVCEKVSEYYQSNERFKYAECKTDAETGASDCAAAIRAMLEDKP